jgi:hypothetical protein
MRDLTVREVSPGQAGADQVIRYDHADFAAAARRLTGGGAVAAVCDGRQDDDARRADDQAARRAMGKLTIDVRAWPDGRSPVHGLPGLGRHDVKTPQDHSLAQRPRTDLQRR